MTFAPKNISLTIQLAQNTQTSQPTSFAESGSNQVTISGLRTSVRVNDAGTPVATATVRVWGLTPSLMNQLATLGLVLNVVPKNIITIQAGDEGAQQSTVFQGTIWAAYGDYSAQPDVPFIMECQQSGANNVIATVPTSFPGPFDVATAMQSLASQRGNGFINNGISIKLNGGYFSGAIDVQIRKIAEAANIAYGWPNGTVMEIWPKNGARNNQNVPVISPQTGMVSYPAFTQQGIIVKTLFNPSISFGGMVQVESSVLSSISQIQAQKGNTFPTTWAVNKLDLALDALLPKGQWMSTVYAYNPGKSNVILAPKQA